MSAARVFEQLTSLMRDGRVSEEVACKLLEESGVVITCNGKQGTYSKGMLKVGAGVVTLDPLSITNISFPAHAVEEPVPVPEPVPTGFSSTPVSSEVDVPTSDPDVVDLDS